MEVYHKPIQPTPCSRKYVGLKGLLKVVVNHPSLRGEKSGDEDKYPSPESLEPSLFIEIQILQLTLS